MVGKIECVMPNYTQRNIKERNLQGLYAERYSLLLQIIRCTRLSALMSDIVQTGRKKFAFGIGLKMTPGSYLAQNLFEIPNGFRLARFASFLLVGFVFCFLCGNKIRFFSCILLRHYFPEYPIQKTFFLWLNLLTFGCTFFFLAMMQDI